MKFIIGFACLIVACSAYQPATFTRVSSDKYNSLPLPPNAFWDEFLIGKAASTTVKQCVHLAIAFFDSSAGEIDDIFPDASFKLAIYYAVSLFTFPAHDKGAADPAHAAALKKVTASFATISAWGTNEAQAAGMVDILLNLTNRAFHHFIDADNDLLGSHGAAIEAKIAAGSIAEVAIKFSLGFARPAVKGCYKSFRDEIVEGTDGIILCEAFAYSVRGFPTESAETAHDAEKKKFMIDFIEVIKLEAQADIVEFVKESLTGIKGYRECIIAEAIALDSGYTHHINEKKVAGVHIPVTTAAKMDEGILPTSQDVAAYAATPIDAKEPVTAGPAIVYGPPKGH